MATASVVTQAAENETRPAHSFDALIIGAGFSGLYQLHCLRDRLGLSVQVLEAAARASAAPGTGTAIPARAAIPKATPTATPSPKELLRGVGMVASAIPGSRRSCAISTMSPTAST